MQIQELEFFDKVAGRKFPAMLYTPSDFDKDNQLKTVIFCHGFQEQERLAEGLLYCKGYEYLANFFTNKGYAFIAPQFQILGDTDSLDILLGDGQSKSRENLWLKYVKTILFVLAELKAMDLELDLNKFIIGGHSTGGDVAQYFASNYSEQISHCILFDSRKCPIKEGLNATILRFEADDTPAKAGILQDEGTFNKRQDVELVIVKPKGVLRRTCYTDRINNKNDECYNPKLKQKIYNTMEWFLGNFGTF